MVGSTLPATVNYPFTAIGSAELWASRKTPCVIVY